MSLKLSSSTADAFRYLGIEGGIKAFAAAGFEALDLGFDGFIPYGDLKKGSSEGIFGESREKVVEYFKGIKAIADRYGIEIGQAHAPFPSYIEGEEASNEFILDVIVKSIYASAAMDCKYIVVHPNFTSDYFDRRSPKEETECNEAFYRRLIPALKETGVVCCLENMYVLGTFRKKGLGAAFSMPYYVNTFIDKMNAEAGEDVFAFCLDVGHALMVGIDPEYFMVAVGERVKILHLQDIYHDFDDHTIPFTGIMPWDRVIRGMCEIGYAGNINLETGYFISKNGKDVAELSICFLANAAKRLRAMHDEQSSKQSI